MRATAMITVSRPVADVFEYISDVEKMGQWVVGVGKTRLVEGDGSSVGDR
ncbi:SRPBCC family protein [Haloarchaeobius sp. TZWWS8]